MKQVIGKLVSIWTRICQRLKRAFSRFSKVFYNRVKLAHEDSKRKWAINVSINGDKAQRQRANIYLRTKNKRIKKKQWALIRPPLFPEI